MTDLSTRSLLPFVFLNDNDEKILHDKNSVSDSNIAFTEEKNEKMACEPFKPKKQVY